VTGTVLTPQAFVKVRWPWLAMLASQLVLTTAFLVLTMLSTWAERMQVIKGSKATGRANHLGCSGRGDGFVDRQSRFWICNDVLDPLLEGEAGSRGGCRGCDRHGGSHGQGDERKGEFDHRGGRS
jgi:hypothetical protein